METKKILVPTIIAIATLVVMTVGATYAFFTVGQTDAFGTSTATATTGEIGGVALSKVDDADLTLNVTATQMLKQDTDQTYYATGSASPKTIGTIAVTGAGTYTCEYSITVTQETSTGNTNNLYEKFQAMDVENKSAGQVYFTINEKTFDFDTANLFDGTNNVYTAKLEGLTEGNNVSITSNLVIVNSSAKDQTVLNNSGITLTYDVTEFKCELTAN